MQDLGKRLARGEASAIAELYDACADRLHHYLTLRVGNRDTASDILQEVFLRVVRGRKRFAAVENPLAYVFTIARNETNRWLGRRRQRPRTIELTAADLFAVDSSDPTAVCDVAELIVAALNRLDDIDRELVELKIYGELTFREISDITDMPAATRYRRALERMRPWLEKQLP